MHSTGRCKSKTLPRGLNIVHFITHLEILAFILVCNLLYQLFAGRDDVVEFLLSVGASTEVNNTIIMP